VSNKRVRHRSVAECTLNSLTRVWVVSFTGYLLFTSQGMIGSKFSTQEGRQLRHKSLDLRNAAHLNDRCCWIGSYCIDIQSVLNGLPLKICDNCYILVATISNFVFKQTNMQCFSIYTIFRKETPLLHHIHNRVARYMLRQFCLSVCQSVCLSVTENCWTRHQTFQPRGNIKQFSRNRNGEISTGSSSAGVKAP